MDEETELLDAEAGQAHTEPSDEDNGNGPTAAELKAENDARAAALKQVAGADDVDPDAEPGTKGQRIPKSRFDEVNNERKALAEQLAQANAALAALATGKTAPAAPTQEEAPPEFDIKAARRARLNALATGDDDAALEWDEKIDEHNRRVARTEALQEMQANQQQLTQRQQAQALQEAAADIKKVYPELDQNSPDADADAIALVIIKRDALMAKGMAAHEALKEASDAVAKRMGFAATGAAPTKGDPVADRLAQARERNARAAAAQPPELGGKGNRATNTARQDVATMTEEEFAALPEAEKKRLRGDM